MLIKFQVNIFYQSVGMNQKFGKMDDYMVENNFSFMCCLITKLWPFKFVELNVCGRPLFAILVTNYEPLLVTA